MSKIVFILGAGAAAQGGCPVMNNFLSTAKRLHETGKIDNFADDIAQVDKLHKAILSRQYNFQLDTINLESLFCALEMAITLDGLPGFELDELCECRTSFLRLVAIVLERTQTFEQQLARGRSPQHFDTEYHFHKLNSPNGYRQISQFVKKAIDNNCKCDFITFNYDIGLEASFILNEIQYSCDQSPSGVSLAIPCIYKLHGSIDWFGDTPCANTPLLKEAIDRAITECQAKPIGYQHANAAPPVYLDYASRLLSCKMAPNLVPPTDDKTHHRNDSRSLWKTAANKISEADVVVACGYSLPDSDIFFKNFWSISSMRNEELRKFYIINKDKKVKEKYLQLLGKPLASSVEIFQGDTIFGLNQLQEIATSSQWTWY